MPPAVPASPAPVPGSTPTYDETLRVPLRWWALTTMFLASVLIAFLVATPVAVAVATTLVLTALAAAVFLSYGSARVVVADGTFRAGRASIPVSLLADPEPLDAEATHRAVGVEADARAYLLLRAYAEGAVRVRVVDPADRTPYWLVSTRDPDRLCAALSAAIGVAATAPGVSE